MGSKLKGIPMAVSIVVGDKGRVTLPESVRKHLGIEEGDKLSVELSDNGTAELVPLALIPRDQIWFAHSEMQERISEALNDVREGRTTRIAKRSDVRPALEKLKKTRRSA
jgi:antitoxin MazE